MRPPKKSKSSDHFQTPLYAVYPLLKYLPKHWHVWECSCGESQIANGLREIGYQVTATDIMTGDNFFDTLPKDRIDCILTNPPYSRKNEFLERCYEIGKPFALLLPITTLETATRQALFQKYGVEVIFFNNRINFKTPSGKGSGAWFATAWFTNWLNIGQQMTFVPLVKEPTIFQHA